MRRVKLTTVVILIEFLIFFGPLYYLCSILSLYFKVTPRLSESRMNTLDDVFHATPLGPVPSDSPPPDQPSPGAVPPSPTPPGPSYDEWNKNNLAEAQLVPESNCSASYFTTGEGGRLGNILCQFATSVRFRIKYGVRIAIVANYREKTLEGLFESLPAPSQKTPCFNSSKVKRLLELDTPKMDFHFGYRKDLAKYFNFNNRDTEITHYHIPDYPCPLIPFLTDYRTKIKKVLPLRKDLVQEAKERIERSLKAVGKERSGVQLISVHIRRTDYLEEMIERNASVPTTSHYIKALNFFRNRCENPLFVALSDDLDWAKEHLNFSDVVFPGDADIGSPMTDFAIIASCDHHIYGIGTFGAMSAFFGNGSVVFFPEYFKSFTYELAERDFDCSSSQIYIHMDS